MKILSEQALVKSADSLDSVPAKKAVELPVQRLPCRGCQVSCLYYGRCHGALWRMPL